MPAINISNILNNVPRYALNLPWFMFDIDNRQLITSRIIPSDIRDEKEIVLAEQPIPGLNYAPVSPGGGANRKLSFSLPLILRNNTLGNVMLLKQFDVLRNQATGLLKIRTGQFTPNPQVLYFWGTGSIPLVYFVKKVGMIHKQGWVNQLGQPQYTEIEFELILDETSALYKAEEAYRKATQLIGELYGTTGTGISSQNLGLGGGRPY